MGIEQSVENSNTENKTLYKFRNWDNNFHRAILIHNKIYIPSIAELNDPFDFQLQLDFSLLDTDSKIERFLDLLVQDYLQANKDQEIDFRKLVEVKNKYRSEIKNHPTIFARKLFEPHLQGNIKHLGVFCLSWVWNNVLMWTHYSNNHSGFCVGFNKEKLSKSKFFGKGGDVDYSKNYPRLDPVQWVENNIEDMFIQSNTKSVDWSYEKEYRYEKIWHPDFPKKEERFFRFENDLIDEIILGLDISKDNETELKETAKRKQVPIYKIQKSDYKYELERIKI